MDGATWANFFALAAALALVRVDVCKVTAHLDGLERAGLQALLAANAAHRAVLDDQSTLVGVRAANIHATVVLATRTHFDDATRTVFGAHTATYALVGIDDRQTCDGVDVECAEVAFLHAVAEAKTAFRAATFTSVERVGESANVGTFVMHFGRRVFA